MITKKPEAGLPEKIAGGDSKAEDELFRRYGEQMKYMAQIRLKREIPTEDLEDIVAEIRQAVLVSLRKGGYDAEKGKTLEAYLAGIAYKVVCQYFRKQKKRAAIDSELPERMPANGKNGLHAIIEKERSKKLRAYLGQLHPKYQEVLVLKFYGRLSIADIAAHLNLQPRRVSERLHYAIKKLTQLCQGDEEL